MTSKSLRKWLALATFCVGGLLVAAVHAAFPEKPIRIIVPFATGGGNDLIARTIAPKLGELLGQPVLVENKPGAAGNIGSSEVARAAPDGHTLLLATNTIVINPSLYASVGFDVMKDLVPAGLIADVQFVLVVHPSVPVVRMDDLVALAKKSSGQLYYASPGAGTPQHLAAELFNMMAGVSLAHIPYKGTGPAINDIVGGHVQLGFATLPPVRPFINTGRLKALAVSGARRSPLLPNLATIEELGINGYEASSWYGILAPAGTPAAVLQTISSALARIMQDKDLQAKLLGQGFEPGFHEPAEMTRVMAADFAKWAKVVKQANIKVD